jgi:hypothetical protein
MAYRLDWKFTVRGARHEDIASVLAEICSMFDGTITMHGDWPSHTFAACRNCAGSTAAWSIDFATAVVRGMTLAQRIGDNWQYQLADETFTGFMTAERSIQRLPGVARAAFTLVAATAPLPTTLDTLDIHIPAPTYSVAIFSEDAGESIVNVTFANGECWSAYFLTLAYVQSDGRHHLMRPGHYCWEPGMVLIEQLTRPAVEAAIAEMMREGTFLQVFQRVNEEA